MCGGTREHVRVLVPASDSAGVPWFSPLTGQSTRRGRGRVGVCACACQFREKVRAALDFRNYYASTPVRLCKEVLFEKVLPVI
jgi:hypothetical protein